MLDADVAVIYGVETKRINEAVKNNSDRFPSGYVIELNNDDKNELVENFDQFNRLKHSSTTPRAFTEKGLYMLATILKSQQALKATLSIIETFPKSERCPEASKNYQQFKIKLNKNHSYKKEES